MVGHARTVLAEGLGSRSCRTRLVVATEVSLDRAPPSPLVATLERMAHRIFTISVASVYPHYVTKVERKGRTKDELDEVIRWLTGFDGAALERHLADGHDVRGLLRRRPASTRSVV